MLWAKRSRAAMERKKHIGVDSFFAERKRLLDAYDTAKAQATDDAVKTEHGFVAEDLAREWLVSFMPKKFGVCKGYIITHSLEYTGDLEEWDIIIYDALEAPILFTRQTSDGASRGERRAIPVEHVRGVLEVKATLSPQAAELSVNKLKKLRHFMGTNTSPNYPKFLCSPFVCAALFFETRVRNLSDYRRALDCLSTLMQEEPQVPLIGGLILRSQREHEHSGYLTFLKGEQPVDLADALEMSTGFQYPDGKFGAFGCFSWGVNSYPMFIFDLLNFLNGKGSPGIGSFYGLDFENVAGSRLFRERPKKETDS
jgi:hypothetical protein